MDRVFGVLEHGQFINGPEVAELEGAMIAHLGVREAVACASGTDALWLALRTLDLQPGDEVITTAFTFFATAGAIVNAGGVPVFVDIDPLTFTIDPTAVEAAITPRTRAIVPVHLYGQMAPMAVLRQIASAAGVALIEDGAQSFGATQRQPDGRVVAAGTLGTFGTLSFFPSKPLGGWGDG
ncbi:MAG: aminotransferase class I/II-fold pyridoxal phosphate-dependent enzyme [Gemmatimonadales bacterium]|nr:aminotransferase class I/II-fold pyridoxal phosphate-dependent enzyme [Gemmatimonadales bacterium]